MMLLRPIVEQLRKGNWKGWDVLRWKMLPEAMMRVFACDCVERLALQERSVGVVLTKAFDRQLALNRQRAAGMDVRVFREAIAPHLQQELFASVPMGRDLFAFQLRELLGRSLLEKAFLSAMRTSMLAIELKVMHQLEEEEPALIEQYPIDSSVLHPAHPLRRTEAWEREREQEDRWQHHRITWLCDAWLTCGVRTPMLMFEGTLPFPLADEAALDA